MGEVPEVRAHDGGWRQLSSVRPMNDERPGCFTSYRALFTFAIPFGAVSILLWIVVIAVIRRLVAG